METERVTLRKGSEKDTLLSSSPIYQPWGLEVGGHGVLSRVMESRESRAFARGQTSRRGMSVSHVEA